MSEYQFVAFRAIDAPVNKKNLAYMRRQSSRAEITPRSLINEYHYGDFRGDPIEMLRRGYDIHLHYANFGIRSLFIRLPHGFPDSKAAKPYLDGESIRFLKDKEGEGGALAIEPTYEPGDLEELWDIDRWLDRLIPLRGEIMNGDLRPLYLAHFAICCDIEHDPDETREAPVPAGLKSLTKAQRALAKFYEISEPMLAAAAQEIGSPPTVKDEHDTQRAWLHSQPISQKDEWLAEFMRRPSSKVRSNIFTQFRKEHPIPAWPTVKLDRTIAELRLTADEIQRAIKKRAAAEAAQIRAIKLAKMADDPKPYLDQTEKLVAQRTSDAYGKIARLLADLREALAERGQTGVAERQAETLSEKYPTLRNLKGALRREGFVPKQVHGRKMK